MDARAITDALNGKWQEAGYGLACCPCHDDSKPSLKISDRAHRADGIEVYCFAGCDWREVKDELAKLGLLDSFAPQGAVSAVRDPVVCNSENDTGTALKIWEAAKPLRASLGERYLIEHRKLVAPELGHCLRFHRGLTALIALMTDPASNEPCGIHRTYLNNDGSKRERKMLGRAGVVRLSPDEDVLEGLGIAEGIEDGLAVLASGWTPVWAALSCGGIERFPVLSGIEALTIFADNDKAGLSAAERCARWLKAGREADVVKL